VPTSKRARAPRTLSAKAALDECRDREADVRPDVFRPLLQDTVGGRTSAGVVVGKVSAFASHTRHRVQHWARRPIAAAPLLSRPHLFPADLAQCLRSDMIQAGNALAGLCHLVELTPFSRNPRVVHALFFKCVMPCTCVAVMKSINKLRSLPETD
jgi:hypothetical protein